MAPAEPPPNTPSPPRLTPAERAPLAVWQRRMGRSFLAAMVLLVALLVLGLGVRVRDAVLIPAGLVYLGLVVYGVGLQLSVRCPRCGARLGAQSRLVLPQRCGRCRVELRPPTSFERRCGVAPWDEPR